MKDKHLGLSLLLLSLLQLFFGCQSGMPGIQRFEDPFPVLTAAPPAPVLEMEPALGMDAVPGGLTPPALEPPGPVEDELEEFVFELEDSPSLSEAEQEELLAQNLWIKNVARINMEDSGRKLNPSALSPEERKRRDTMNRLNMDKNQLAKLNNQHYEYIDGTASDWRWMHRGVDKLYAAPPAQRVQPDTFLRDKKYKERKYAVLRANAAILLGRDGNPAVGHALLQIVQHESMDMKIRCAAAEVLGRMPTISADELIPLLDNAGTTELWEELLVAIAEKIDPWEHDCFLEPFYSPISEIRLAAAKLWRRKSYNFASRFAAEAGEAGVPAQWDSAKLIEILRRENNPAVRVELIKTLGIWQIPGLYPILEADLRHRTAEIRNAAMQALADAGCEEAIPNIKDQLRDSLGANRAVAASALRKLGASDEIFARLLDDQDPAVRVEVAQAFSVRCTPQIADVAKTYIADRNARVQLATVEAIGSWSVEESGPLLLTAAKSPFQDVRCRAVEMLARRGIAYAGFDPEAKPESQTAQYQELVEVFREAVGVDPTPVKTNNDTAIQQVSATVPENAMLSEVRRCLDDWSDRTVSLEGGRELIERRLIALGQHLMPNIDHLLTVEQRHIPESLDRVFAEVDPMFREIEKLKSDDMPSVRQAAIELSRQGATRSPPKLAAKRIVELAAKHEDPLVLTHLSSALENADSELVCELARPLLQSDSVRVRRIACEMLGHHGTSGDVPLLHESLNDSNPAVSRGALLALGTLLDGEETVDSAVLGTLKAMLIQGDPRMQTDVAATLHRLGHAEGTNALRRLALHNDHQVRVYVARTLPALQDSAFEPILIHFLDDKNGTVRNEALKGLPVLTGQDIGGGGSTQQQIDRWKERARGAGR